MQDEGRCSTCGSVLVRKQPGLLLVVAALMLAGCTALFHFVHGVRFIGFTFGLAGCYLVAWALIGKGRWCRQCKRFPIG